MHLHEYFTYVLPFKMGLHVQLLAKIEHVAIVSGVTFNFTYCVSTCVSSGKNHEQPAYDDISLFKNANSFTNLSRI